MDEAIAGGCHDPAIIDGVPPGIELSVEDLMADLNRRRPGESRIVTQRNEPDEPDGRVLILPCTHPAELSVGLAVRGAAI